jgi:hypothetical protein
MLKLYADESVNDATSLINLSGYLMTEDQFAALDEKIQKARGDLPYFHMKEGHHKKHPQVYQKIVDLITPQAVLCGISVSFFLNEFNKLMSLKTNGQSLKYWFGGSCTFATGAMMALCSGWLNQSPHRNELVAYVFENGPFQEDANTFWAKLSLPRYKKRKESYHYASHTFVDGKGPLGSVLQVCDILAWNLNKMQREKKKSPELNRLFVTPTLYKHHGGDDIARNLHLTLDHWYTHDKHGKPYKKNGKRA